MSEISSDALYKVIIGNDTLAGNSFLVNFDPQGNLNWGGYLNAGFPYYTIINSCTYDHLDNLFITGRFTSPSLNLGSGNLQNTGSSDLYVAKLGVASAVQNLNYLNKIEIYPNPATENIRVKHQSTHIHEMEIISAISGATQKMLMVGYDDEIKVSNLSKGVYIIKLYDDNGQVVVSKFLKL